MGLQWRGVCVADAALAAWKGICMGTAPFCGGKCGGGVAAANVDRDGCER